MKETVITWTVANWVTVFLMFMSMLLFVGLCARLIASWRMARES